MKLKLTKDPSHKGYYQDAEGNLYVFRFGGRPIKVDGYRDDKPKENVNREEVTVKKEKVIDHSKTANAKDDEEYYKEIEIEKKKAEDNDEAILRYSQEFSMKSPVNDLEAAQNYLSDDDMTKYVPDELVNVVQKAEWVLDDESSGHINIETARELNAEEQKILSDWIDGQNSDGLGEGFEQQEFAESYFDPNSGDGPYTRYEAEEEINRRIEDMDYSVYESYIDESEIEAAIDNYIEENGLEYTEDEDIRLGYRAEIEDDPFEYFSDDVLYEARDKAAMDDTYFNIDEWYNMSSMETHDKDFIIEEVQNLNQEIDLESMIRHSNAEYTDNGNVMFYSKEDFKNFGQTIADKLNDKYAKDYYADFRYRINKNDSGGEYLELYDANESVESTNHIYEDLAKEVKSYFGEEGVDVFADPYDNVSVTLAGFYGEDYVDEEDTLSSMSNNEITHRIFSRYPDVSEEDEDYLNSLSHDDLVKEVKNRGWNLEDEEVELFNKSDEQVKKHVSNMNDEDLKKFAKEVYNSDDNSHPYKDNIVTQEFYKRFGEEGWKTLENRPGKIEESKKEPEYVYDKGDYSSLAIKDKKYEVLESSNSAFGTELYKLKDEEGNIFYKPKSEVYGKAEKESNENLTLMNRYSGTISTLQELHPEWSMAKIMDKIKKLEED